MDYDILEARIEFKAGKLQRITVLVDCTPSDLKPYTDVRAIYATNRPAGGYTHIMDDAIISEDLLQEIAGYGMETVDRDKIFPNWKNKQQPQLNNDILIPNGKSKIKL